MNNHPTSMKFRLGDNIKEFVSSEMGEQIVQILETENLIRKLPECQQVWIVYKGKVPTDTLLAKAHGTWKESHFPNIQTPQGFIRQPLESACPSSTVHVEVECIEQVTRNMSSYYGFKGYFLSLLIALDEKKIWDARGEQAT